MLPRRVLRARCLRTNGDISFSPGSNKKEGIDDVLIQPYSGHTTRQSTSGLLQTLAFQMLNPLTIKQWVQRLDMVDNSRNLCKSSLGLFFRQWVVQTGHLTLE